MAPDLTPEPGDTVWFVSPDGQRTEGTVDAVWPEEGVLRISYGDRMAGIYSLAEVDTS